LKQTRSNRSSEITFCQVLLLTKNYELKSVLSFLMSWLAY